MKDNTDQRPAPPAARFDRVWDVLFVLVLLLSLAVRVSYLSARHVGSDEALYLWYAGRLSADFLFLFSKQIIEYHPPLFPLLMAFFKLIFNAPWAYRLVPLLFSLSGVALVYAFGARLGSRFAGLCAALGLGFNFLYLYDGTLVMLDVPLAVGFLGLSLLLTYVRSGSSFKLDVCVGTAAAAVILLKWAGVLVLPYLGIVYGFLPGQKSAAARIKKAGAALCIPAVVTVVLLLNNLFKLGTVFPDTSALAHTTSGSFLYYFKHFHNIIIYPAFIPLFVYGGYRLIRDKNDYWHILIFFFVLGFLGISFIGVKKLSYAVILLPVIFLVSGYGLDGLLRRLSRTPRALARGRAAALLIFCAVVGGAYPRAAFLIHKNHAQIAGYDEAAEWLNRNIPSDAVIVARNARIIRYYSGIEFAQFGGRLTPCPVQREEFEAVVAGSRRPVFLFGDIWTVHQPAEVHLFPRNSEEQRYLTQSGFRVQKVIEREIYAAGGQKKLVPVSMIWGR